MKTIHAAPFKFGVGEKVWVPGISDIGKIKERGRTSRVMSGSGNHYLVAYDGGREAWHEEYSLDSLSEPGVFERIMREKYSRGYSEGVQEIEEGLTHSPAERQINGDIVSAEHYFNLRYELADIKKRLKSYEKWRSGHVS